MSDPFRDDRAAQLARAEALSVDNARLEAENAALKEKLAGRAARPSSTAASSDLAPAEAAAPMVVGLVFRIRANPARPAAVSGTGTVTLDGQVVKIGRVTSAQLRFDDPSVARMHAVIEAPTAAGTFIFDLGSPGGTFVNGQRITRAALRCGDVIRFGQVEVELVSIVEAR